MRTAIRTELASDKITQAAKAAELTARQEYDGHVQHTALRLAQARILQLEEELAQMHKLAHEDALTGILNRRGLETALEREFSRVKRQNKPLCLALIDIDDFKQINDTFGHAAGDQALVHFTKVVISTLRKADIFACVGGEEFVVALPETTEDQAKLTIDRLQRTLASARFEHAGTAHCLTFSAGLSERQSEQDPALLIRRADTGAAIAKRNGKNRTVVN